jgi:hypothetical protein
MVEESEQNLDETSPEDEEETCGFCIFMKGGGCKREFEAWSQCVDSERQAENDFTETCKDVVRFVVVQPV